jgi:hypothetical protein
MLDLLLANTPHGIQDTFSAPVAPPIVVVLAGPKGTNVQQRLLVNCVITKVPGEYMEITCAD